MLVACVQTRWSMLTSKIPVQNFIRARERGQIFLITEEVCNATSKQKGAVQNTLTSEPTRTCLRVCASAPSKRKQVVVAVADTDSTA